MDRQVTSPLPRVSHLYVDRPFLGIDPTYVKYDVWTRAQLLLYYYYYNYYYYYYSIQELDQNPERIEVALYNLTADPYERNDLSNKSPDVANKLKDRSLLCIRWSLLCIKNATLPRPRIVL